MREFVLERDGGSSELMGTDVIQVIQISTLEPIPDLTLHIAHQFLGVDGWITYHLSISSLCRLLPQTRPVPHESLKVQTLSARPHLLQRYAFLFESHLFQYEQIKVASKTFPRLSRYSKLKFQKQPSLATLPNFLTREKIPE